MSKNIKEGYSVPIDLLPANVAVYRYVDGDFIFVDFNKAAEKTENILKDQLIGKKVIDVFPGVEELGLLDLIKRVYKTGRSEESNLGYYEDERIKGWRSNIVSRLPSGDVLVVYKDENEFKEAQQRLESLGYIVDNTTVEVFIFDINSFRFTYLNKQAQKNIGYSLEEMKNMTPVDIKPQYNEQNFKKLIKGLVDGTEDSLVFETLHQRKDGSIYNVEIHIKVIEFNNKKEYVVFAHDITKRKEEQKALINSEEKFRLITENSSMGVFIYQEYFVYVNDAFCNITGYSQDELYKMHPWDIVSKDLQSKFKEIAYKRMNGEQFQGEHIDINIDSKKNLQKELRILTQTINYNDKFSGLGSVVDVTDLKETKRQLKVLAQAIEQTDEMVKITDKDGVITYVNEASIAHSGYRSIELIGQNMKIFNSGKHENSFYKELWDTILSGKSYKNIIINKKKNQELYYEEETITPIVDENQEIKHFVITSHDITERIEMEKELNKLATFDSLTSIYNRYKINEELELEISKSKRYKGSFSVLMFDIDNFKNINDSYGHDTGDYVLKELSKITLEYIRKSDVFGRWGGEEFIIISPLFEKDKIEKFANKLKEHISSHNFDKTNGVTISMGAVIYNGVDDKNSLLKRVDALMYKAKEMGKNLVVFE